MNLKTTPLEGKACLVVDDFGDMRSMIRNMLIGCGIKNITVAVNGLEALECMAHRRFDAVLCDYNLGPGKDGQQVLEEARHRNLIGLGCVFLMVTAENTREMVMGAVEYEPDSYLTKPFNKNLLKSRLEKQIAKKQDLLPVERAMRGHDHSLAIELLDRKLAENPPNSSELNKLKGQICLAAGEIALARDVYKAILEVRDIPWARLGLGRCLFLEKNYDEAREVFHQLTEDHRAYTAAYDWLAKTCKCLNQMDAAQKALQTATEISPKVVLRQQMLGEIALHNQDNQTAEAAFSNAVKHGRHSVYKNPSNNANLAKVTAVTKPGDTGLKILQEMKREFNKDPRADFYIATAECLIQEGMGNSDGARQALERAAGFYESLDHSLDPDCALEMATTYGRLGITDKAIDLMHQAILNNHADEELMSEVRTTMESMGIHEETVNAIESLRQEVASLNNRAVELAKNGKLTEAIKLLEETSARMPGNKVVNLNAALVLLMDMEQKQVTTERTDKIAMYLQRVKRIEPSNSTLNKLQNRLRKILKTANGEN